MTWECAACTRQIETTHELCPSCVMGGHHELADDHSYEAEDEEEG